MIAMKDIFSFLGGKKPQTSASQAKERLQIILAHERIDGAKAPDFLPKLKEELLAVLAKYVKVDANNFNVSLDRKGNLEILDVNVVIDEMQPPSAPATATPAATPTAA